VVRFASSNVGKEGDSLVGNTERELTLFLYGEGFLLGGVIHLSQRMVDYYHYLYQEKRKGGKINLQITKRKKGRKQEEKKRGQTL